MCSLRLDCKGCQRHKDGKVPAERAQEGFTAAVDHNCKPWPESHSGLDEQIPAPGTRDAEPELQDPRKDLQSQFAEGAQRVFHTMWRYTLASVAACPVSKSAEFTRTW